jgi:Uma2 family endonuclease
VWCLDNGVQRALLVDPADRSMVSFAARQQPRALRADEPVDFSPALPGFGFTVDELFEPLRLDP